MRSLLVSSCVGVLVTFVTMTTTGTVAAGALPRSVALSRGWVFQPDPLEVGETLGWQRPDCDRGRWRAVTVPGAWDEYDAAMDGYEGVCWYAFHLPASQIDVEAWQRLRFGRVNHRARVWIDGERVAEDSLGYLPFDVDATPRLKAGQAAWIVVRVENGTRYDWLPGTPTVEWVQYGGLLEPVEWITTPLAYLARVSIDARPRGGQARIVAVVEVQNSGAAEFHGRVLVEAAGKQAEAAVHADPGRPGIATVEIALPNPRLWSPERPALYTAKARLLGGGDREIDGVTERFGIRSIEARGRQLLLNGEPIRIRGVNRYNELPGRGPAGEEAAIRADLAAVKAAGANFVRVHFPQTPTTLRIADELGLLYMEEVPLNWWRATWHRPPPPQYQNDRIIDSAEQALDRMVRRDGNHPSIVVWSMSNECLTSDSLGMHAMERLIRRARSLDSTRLVTYVANHAIEKNTAFRLADLVAVNLYYGMWDGDVADRVSQLDSLVRGPTRERLAEIAGAFPDTPVLLSEFGTIGVPGSGGDVRFSEDYQAAYVAAVWQAVLDRPEICGGVVWSWADYRHRRGFTNDFPAFFGPFGLVTYDRKPKKALTALGELWRRHPSW